MFEIRLGIPDMKSIWDDLNNKINSLKANKDEIRLHKKLLKVFSLLSQNPQHNSLNTHEIKILTRRYKMKVWQSYLENKKPVAGRINWVYYPSGSITIIGLEPHPNDSKNSYEKISLSNVIKNK